MLLISVVIDEIYKEVKSYEYRSFCDRCIVDKDIHCFGRSLHSLEVRGRRGSPT